MTAVTALIRPLLCLLAPVLVLCATASGQSDPSADLVAVEGRFGSIEWRPGVGVDQYRRIALLDVHVALRDNWLRDHNRGKRGFNEVTEEDKANVIAAVANEFTEHFTATLEQQGEFRINEVVGAADLLLLRPAILNVSIPPSTYGSQGLSPESSFIGMTLYLELYDSATSTLIGRIVDGQTEQDQGRRTVQRIFRRWAEELHTFLKEDF